MTDSNNAAILFRHSESLIYLLTNRLHVRAVIQKDIITSSRNTQLLRHIACYRSRICTAVHKKQLLPPQLLQNNSHSILIRSRLRALVIIYTHHSRQTVERTPRQGKLLRSRQIRTDSSSALAHSTAVNRLHRQMQHRHASFSLDHLQNIAAVLLIRQYRIAERQPGIQQLAHRRHIITAVINNDGYFSSELPDGPLLLLFCLLLR